MYNFWTVVTVLSLQALWLVFLTVLSFKNAKRIAEESPQSKKMLEEAMQPLFDSLCESVDRWKAGIELEWSNTLDKVNTMAGRVSKRSGVLESQLREEEEKRAAGIGKIRPDHREEARRALRKNLRK